MSVGSVSDPWFAEKVGREMEPQATRPLTVRARLYGFLSYNPAYARPA